MKNQLNQRLKNSVLRTGFCDVEALDDDTIRITRYALKSRDALGNLCRRSPVVVEVKR